MGKRLLWEGSYCGWKVPSTVMVGCKRAVGGRLLWEEGSYAALDNKLPGEIR